MLNAPQILEWYLDAGVDEAIDDAPVNRLVTAPPSTPIARNAPPLAEPRAAAPVVLNAVAPSEAMARARAAADAASTLAELEAAVRAFDGLVIKKTAMNTVFADGNPKAALMIIGEAPGAQEDQRGIPFCGPSGQLLDKMLAAIGLNRQESAYISNTVFWRPPGNRAPTPEELATCQPFVQKHIALVKPKLLMLAGGVATSALLQKEISLSKLRMKTYEYATPYLDAPVPAVVTFHPSYLLRTPAQKRLAWQDLLFIKQILGSNY